MESSSREVMDERHPPEEVGYLIYCPTEEELEDRSMEDFKDDLGWELGEDFREHGEAGMQMVAQSLCQDGNTNVSQSTVMSTKDLPSEKATTGDERYPEANHWQAMEKTLPDIPSNSGFEPQFDSSSGKSFMTEYWRSVAETQDNIGFKGPSVADAETIGTFDPSYSRHNVGFEGRTVSETETIDMSDPSNSHRDAGGRNSHGEMTLCEIGESTEVHTYECSCGRCSQYANHLNQREKSNANYLSQREKSKPKCSFCNKEFLYKCHLERHVKIHTGERPFQCPVCDKAFAQKESLKSHLVIHSDKKGFKCSVCNKEFAHKSYLHTHMKIHTGERPHECEVCEKRFYDRKHLKRHMRSHTGERPHECTVCNLRFSQRPSLKIHMRRHHTREKPFECSVCQRRFCANHELSNHMRTHTGKRPFKCSVCGKAFSQTSAYYVHQRTHTGEKPYKCLICSRQFSQRCTLTRHMKTHKGEKENEKEEEP